MAERLPPARPTILVVEDEALLAMMVEDTLAEAGFGAVWAPGGRGAPLAEPSPPPLGEMHAAVVDLRLADGVDGRDVLRRLRQHTPGLPAVVVTGFEARAPQADLRGLGGPTVRLFKPFDCDELVSLLAEMVRRPAAAPPASPAPRRRASDRAGAAVPVAA